MTCTVDIRRSLGPRSLAAASPQEELYPIHVAAFLGNYYLLRVLVSKGANFNQKTSKAGATPIWKPQMPSFDVVCPMYPNTRTLLTTCACVYIYIYICDYIYMYICIYRYIPGTVKDSCSAKQQWYLG